MAMEFKAKVIQVNPEINGTGRNGTWRKQEVIVETGGQYSKKVCLHIWGDKIDTFALQAGQEHTFAVDVESREYNGRWYTDVKVFALKQDGGTQPNIPQAPTPDNEWNQKATTNKAANEASWANDSEDDDLPF